MSISSISSLASSRGTLTYNPGGAVATYTPPTTAIGGGTNTTVTFTIGSSTGRSDSAVLTIKCPVAPSIDHDGMYIVDVSYSRGTDFVWSPTNVIGAVQKGLQAILNRVSGGEDTLTAEAGFGLIHTPPYPGISEPSGVVQVQDASDVSEWSTEIWSNLGKSSVYDIEYKQGLEAAYYEIEAKNAVTPTNVKLIICFYYDRGDISNSWNDDPIGYAETLKSQGYIIVVFGLRPDIDWSGPSALYRYPSGPQMSARQVWEAIATPGKFYSMHEIPTYNDYIDILMGLFDVP